jgi:type I site-specific restriction endonuclease
MLAIKERSFRLTPDSSQLDILAQVEHNRWNIEKLLMGYRPLTAEERETKNKKELKDLKDQYFAHPDICAYNSLPESQKDIDRILSKALPLIKNQEENEEK